MGGNLRDRLKRIQLVKQNEIVQPADNTVSRNDGGEINPHLFEERGWVSAGYKTLRRQICGEEIPLPEKMPEASRLVMPGIDTGTAYEDLLFFDLETTGLSGGAGTAAFLAAFGRLENTGKAGQTADTGAALYRLRITQYLLLDYPGESDFIEALSGEFKPDGFTMVSYNGKCFDSQILKNRCLMNGIKPPEYRHADLLHPARRLWKKILPDCSQGTIETNILGIDRTGDIPGFMAPEAWFSFLKDGNAGLLFGICDHNRRDISGLASIFSAMVCLASDPVSAIEKINYDPESLALRLYRAGGKTEREETGRRLLVLAAERGGLRALRVLAIDSEWRLKDFGEALEWAARGLELSDEDSALRIDFEKRSERLRKKLSYEAAQ